MPANNVPSRAICKLFLQILACFVTRGRCPGTSRLGAGRARYGRYFTVFTSFLNERIPCVCHAYVRGLHSVLMYSTRYARVRRHSSVGEGAICIVSPDGCSRPHSLGHMCAVQCVYVTSG